MAGGGWVGRDFGSGDETIPEYNGHAWTGQWEELDGKEDNEAAMDLPVWLFYRAASLHRTYVLRDLLPKQVANRGLRDRRLSDPVICCCSR